MIRIESTGEDSWAFRLHGRCYDVPLPDDGKAYAFGFYRDIHVPDDFVDPEFVECGVLDLSGRARPPELWRGFLLDISCVRFHEGRSALAPAVKPGDEWWR